MEREKVIGERLEMSRKGVGLWEITVRRDTGGIGRRWVLRQDGKETKTTYAKGRQAVFAIDQLTLFDYLHSSDCSSNKPR